MDDSIPSLHEWIGGTQKLEALTERFYEKVLAEPMLRPLFEHMDADHTRHVAHFIAEVFGGPSRYTEERGGHDQMLARHVGKNITEAHRQRWVQLLLETADEIGVPDDPEFRSAFVAYIEWGSRLAVINSQPGVEVEKGTPMPRWGWGEVGGPYQNGS